MKKKRTEAERLVEGLEMLEDEVGQEKRPLVLTPLDHIRPNAQDPSVREDHRRLMEIYWQNVKDENPRSVRDSKTIRDLFGV